MSAITIRVYRILPDGTRVEVQPKTTFPGDPFPPSSHALRPCRCPRCLPAT